MTPPHTAPAATDVVCPGGAAVLIRTLSPASARLIAVVRPTAPAPITRTSMPRPYPLRLNAAGEVLVSELTGAQANAMPSQEITPARPPVP